MNKQALALIIFLVICKHAFGQSKELIAAFGGTLSPWVIKDGSGGILVDILKDCLEPSGYKVKTRLIPYARRITEFQSEQVAVVSDINEKLINEKNLKGYFTGNIYTYENFLFSLSDRKLKINQIADLSEYSLLSWQGAIAHIGGEYAVMAKQNKNYSETHNQKTQLRMLFNRRVDFIQMDGNIYEFYRKEMLENNELDATISVDVLPLFGKNPNGYLFKNEAARDACIKNLAAVRKDKKYKDVLYFGK